MSRGEGLVTPPLLLCQWLCKPLIPALVSFPYSSLLFPFCLCTEPA